MKKILIVLQLFICTVLYSQTLPEHGDSYVNDFADVMGADQLSALENKVRALEEQTSIELSIVTISSLEGYDIETYSTKLFAKWGIGKKGLNNGMLVLVAVDDHKWRIEVGYGLEGWMTDLDSKRLGSGNLPHNFKLGKYYEGLNSLTDGIITKLGPESWAQREAYLKQKEKERQEAQSQFINIVILIGAILLFGAIMAFVYFQAKRREDKIKKEKEEKEKQIQEISDWIAKTISKFNSSLVSLKVAEREGFPGASILVKKFREANFKIEDLCKQMVDTVESMNAQKILLQNIVHSISIEADILFATKSKVEEIKEYANGGSSGIITKLAVKLKKAADDYNDVIKKYGIDVWSYNFAFEFKPGYNLLDLAQELALESRNITSNDLARDFIKREKEYNASVEYIRSVEKQIELVKNRIDQIESAAIYVEKSKAGSLRVKLNEMESYRHKSDVSSTTKHRIDRAKEDAQRMINSNFKNPLEAYSNISACISSMEDAIRKAKSDISDEESSRRRKESAIAATASRERMNSSSSDNDSSFGGFGGGRSGGGGASGNW